MPTRLAVRWVLSSLVWRTNSALLSLPEHYLLRLFRWCVTCSHRPITAGCMRNGTLAYGTLAGDDFGSVACWLGCSRAGLRCGCRWRHGGLQVGLRQSAVRTACCCPSALLVTPRDANLSGCRLDNVRMRCRHSSNELCQTYKPRA